MIDWAHLGELLLHAVKDTYPLLPWILLIYLLIAIIIDFIKLKFIIICQ